MKRSDVLANRFQKPVKTMLLYRLFALLLGLNLAAQASQADAEGFAEPAYHSWQYQPSQYRSHQGFQPQHQRLNSHRGFTIELSEIGGLIGFSDVRTRLDSRRGSEATNDDEGIGELADRLLPRWMGDAIEESAEVIVGSNKEKRGFRPRCKYDSAPAFLQDALQQAHYQVNLYGDTSTFVVGWLF